MTKIFTLFIITTILLSCEKTQPEINLNGNWYSNSTKELKFQDIDYVEIYIKNDSLNLCSERFGTIPKLKIFLSNDSLYFYSKNIDNYKGKVFNHTEMSFDLGEDSSNKRTYYKLQNSQNLEKHVKREITEEELYQAFTKRKNIIYKTSFMK